MKEYLLSLFGVCVASAVVRVASPSGSLKKYLEIVCSMCVAAALIIPVGAWIMDGDGIEGALEGIEWESQNYEEIYNSYVLEYELAEAENMLVSELAEHFGKAADGFDVELLTEWNADKVGIAEARVILNEKTLSVPPEQIKGYIYERLECECEIIYLFNDENNNK